MAGSTRWSLVTVATLSALALAAPGAWAAPGSLDKTFSSDGMQQTDWPGQYQSVRSTVVQKDGRIVVAGQAREPNRFALVRYRAGGGLDQTFGGDGRVLTPFLDGSTITEVSVDRKGRIIAVGWASRTGVGDSVYRAAIARYRPDGTLDHSFSDDGKALFDFSRRDRSSDAYGVAPLRSGKIIIVGDVAVTADGQDYDFLVARLTADGRLDHTFGGGDGKTQVDFTPNSDGAWRVVVLRDGRLVTGGWAQTGHSPNATYDTALVGLTTDGRLDHTFGGDGKVRIDLRPGSADYVNGLERVPGTDDMVAALWAEYPAGARIALARFDSSGRLVHGFGGDGYVGRAFGASYSIAAGVAVQQDGKPVVVGMVDGQFAIVRFRSNGATDAGFGSGGVVKPPFPGATGGEGDGVALYRGRIVAGGTTTHGNPTRFAAARILP